MKCNVVQKKLLRFLDDELSVQERNEIQQHLKECEECSARLHKVSDMWGSERAFPKIDPDPFAWQKLYLKISEKQNQFSPGFAIQKQLGRLVLAGGLAALFVLSIFTGIYLGTDPQLTYDSNTTNNLTEQQFVKMVHIDSFDDVPPGSIGSVYFSMSAEMK